MVCVRCHFDFTKIISSFKLEAAERYLIKDHAGSYKVRLVGEFILRKVREINQKYGLTQKNRQHSKDDLIIVRGSLMQKRVQATFK